MRYELDQDGYIKTVLWGCITGTCAEYTGEVPTGYSSLIEWADNACVNAYYLDESGNLILDSNREAELKSLHLQQEEDYTPIYHKDIPEMGLLPKLLWTNPNSSADVNDSTTYSGIGDKKYNLYLIIFNVSTSSERKLGFWATPGVNGEAQWIGNVSSDDETYFLARRFIITSTMTFKCYSCYKKTSSATEERNNGLIPYKIYGFGTI
jgi:hypothetical protein